MAHSLGIQVMAEGLELKEQVLSLAAEGVDELQGYYFAQPMPIHEFNTCLQNKN